MLVVENCTCVFCGSKFVAASPGRCKVKCWLYSEVSRDVGKCYVCSKTPVPSVFVFM